MTAIRMALAGGSIAITLHREAGQWSKVRHISASEALVLSLLLTSDAPNEALNFEVDDGVSLQIENRPYDRAWLGIDARHGGCKLVACLEGNLIREIGRCLRNLSDRALAGQLQSTAYSFCIDHCYLDE